jgi:hypothetical protein
MLRYMYTLHKTQLFINTLYQEIKGATRLVVHAAHAYDATSRRSCPLAAVVVQISFPLSLGPHGMCTFQRLLMPYNALRTESRIACRNSIGDNDTFLVEAMHLASQQDGVGRYHCVQWQCSSSFLMTPSCWYHAAWSIQEFHREVDEYQYSW